MASTRTFNDMLNDHLNYSLLKEEIEKRVLILDRCEKDNDWKGGTLPVPFKAAQASSIEFGALSSSTDIAENKYVRGEISTQPELWGSMVFNHRDFIEHDGKVNEKSFLKLLPEVLEDFMSWVQNAVSVTMLNGSHFAKATADGDASGNLTVDRPDRFEIGQKVSIDDDNSTAATGYVSAININTGVVTFVTARGGATPVDLSGYTTAQNAKCYYVGSQASGFTSLKSSLLSAANGGGSTLYGQTKTAYPFLQAINVSGATISAVNILEKIFDAFITIRKIGKGMPDEVIMSYKHFGSVLKVLESGKGSFNIVAGSKSAAVYGWTTITVGGIGGVLKLTAVNEMDDDFIAFMDWSACKVHSNGYFRKRVGPDGRSYFEVRNTTGYAYIQDMCFFGDLVLNKPSRCGVLHSISY
jgi:hypothetical protein